MAKGFTDSTGPPTRGWEAGKGQTCASSRPHVTRTSCVSTHRPCRSIRETAHTPTHTRHEHARTHAGTVHAPTAQYRPQCAVMYGSAPCCVAEMVLRLHVVKSSAGFPCVCVPFACACVCLLFVNPSSAGRPVLRPLRFHAPCVWHVHREFECTPSHHEQWFTDSRAGSPLPTCPCPSDCATDCTSAYAAAPRISTKGTGRPTSGMGMARLGIAQKTRTRGSGRTTGPTAKARFGTGMGIHGKVCLGTFGREGPRIMAVLGLHQIQNVDCGCKAERNSQKGALLLDTLFCIGYPNRAPQVTQHQQSL